LVKQTEAKELDSSRACWFAKELLKIRIKCGQTDGPIQGNTNSIAEPAEAPRRRENSKIESPFPSVSLRLCGFFVRCSDNSQPANRKFLSYNPLISILVDSEHFDRKDTEQAS